MFSELSSKAEIKRNQNIRGFRNSLNREIGIKLYFVNFEVFIELSG